MAVETLGDLVWKMECKGYSWHEIQLWTHGILLLNGPLFLGDSDSIGFWKKYYDEALAQAHVEIDFTNYKKNSYVKNVVIFGTGGGDDGAGVSFRKLWEESFPGGYVKRGVVDGI